MYDLTIAKKDVWPEKILKIQIMNSRFFEIVNFDKLLGDILDI